MGARIKAYRGEGRSRSDCKIGRTKAAAINDESDGTRKQVLSEDVALFPEPVSARPMMSLPERASGMAFACIGVACVYFSEVQASQRLSTMP